MGNAVSKKQIVVVTGESVSQKDPCELQTKTLGISSLKQHFTGDSEGCYSTYAKLLPKKNEASARSYVSHLMKSMKQNGVMEIIEKNLRSLQCLNCSVEEIAISLKTVTSHLSLVNRPTYMHKHLADLYAVYFWVAKNISYDVLGWADIVDGRKFPNVSCEYVLENRLTVCNGYANIFMALANEMGYKAVVIDGHFRVSLCDQKQQYPSFFSPNSANTHSWNAVKLESSWHLFDCTYGSGILSQGCFKSKFTSEYFMVPPEQLIFSHWPDDHRWQLLQTPITLQELQPLQVMSPSSFSLGTARTQFAELLQIESNTKDPVINIELKIMHDDAVVIAKLSDWPASNERQSASGYDYDTLIFIDQSERDKSTIYAIAHDQGMYQIKLFIKTPFSEAKFLCTYLISCQVSSNADTLGFPVVRSHVNGFNLINWRDPYQPTLHYVAECNSGEMIFQFEVHDVSKITHFITPFKVIDNKFPDAKYHYYSAIHPFQGHWKLHVVFPKCGLWTVCIASMENNEEIVSLMIYEVNILQIKERRGYLSYPYSRATDALNIQLSEPICTNGDKIIQIEFSSEESSAFHSCISNGGEEFTQYSKVTKTNPNVYCMQIIIPQPGNWTVYLFGKQSTNESRCLMTCFFEVPCCLENCFFPIVNENLVEKYNVKHDLILMQNNSAEFQTTLKSSNELSLQTRFHEGWASGEKKVKTSLLVDHSAMVSVINSKEHVVKVIFPKTGRWTLMITAILPDVTHEEVLMVLKLEANSGNNYSHGLFIKPFPAFFSNRFQWHSESDLYDFEVNDPREIVHNFSIPSNCAVECNMFQIQEPSVIYKNQSILLFSNTECTLKMLFPLTGEWCVRLLSSDGLALQLYYSVHKAVPNVQYPWIQRSFYERYRLAIIHPTLQFPSNIIYPTTFEMTIHKPNSTELIHEASVNDIIMRGATRLITINDSNEYLLTVTINKPGTWEIRLFAQICSSAWTHVLSHKMAALACDDVYY